MMASSRFMHAPFPLPIDRASLPSSLSVFFEDPASPDGRGFRNPWGVNLEPEFSRLLKWQTQTNPWKGRKRKGSAEPKVVGDVLGALADHDEGGRLTWLGHASVLVAIDGVHVLIDPVFGWAGPVRRHVGAPLSPDALPRIDVVAVTHGHYDHLDRPSLRALGRRFGDDVLFVTPRNLGSALPGACRRRIALTWWESVTVRGVDITLVPAQHWHRRGLADTNRSLWGGFVVKGSRSVYHSGDTGHFDGFAAIGHAFPDLDMAVLPIGAWEPRWFMADQHMDPDGSVRAFQQLGAARFHAMHWNTFDLTDEPLDEGPDELQRAAERAGVPWDSRFIVPAHGETTSL
jgi:L-ascorbate metabolism protein UlaG (beta-lactamase superfamily)